jgi:hypothetical protein
MGQRLCSFGSMIVRFGSTNDIVGEVAHPVAYALCGAIKAISDTKTRGVMGAYAALSNPFPISPTISTNVMPYTWEGQERHAGERCGAPSRASGGHLDGAARRAGRRR